jgi:hypothetical protein
LHRVQTKGFPCEATAADSLCALCNNGNKAEKDTKPPWKARERGENGRKETGQRNATEEDASCSPSVPYTTLYNKTTPSVKKERNYGIRIGQIC